MSSLRSKLIAEFTGTFALVFCGTGAIVINDISGGAITHLGVAMTFGLIVSAMIFALGDVSGAHLNPAVTVAFTVAGRFSSGLVLPYLLAQVTGALAASATLRLLFSDHLLLGATQPAGSAVQSLVLELILTLILVMVIFNVSSGAKEKGITAAIAIGGTVGLEALFAGPVCGASMNPVRSLSPAVISGHFDHLWIYLTAPFGGALLGVGLHHLLYNREK
jgi:aquaporin Z